jgi:hypothetical protein
MTTNDIDPSAVAEPVGTTVAEKDGSSTPETLTHDGAAPKEPVSEKAAKPESPRQVHGAKVREPPCLEPTGIKVS